MTRLLLMAVLAEGGNGPPQRVQNHVRGEQEKVYGMWWARVTMLRLAILMLLAAACAVALEEGAEVAEGTKAAEKTRTGWLNTHVPRHRWHVFIGGNRIHHPHAPPLPGLPSLSSILAHDFPIHRRHHDFDTPMMAAKLKPPSKDKFENSMKSTSDDEFSKHHDAETVARSCAFELDGYSFDLSKLRLSDGMPEYATEDTNKHVYKLNICGTSTTMGSDCQRANGMICQYSASPMLQMIGVVGRWGQAPFPKWGFIDDGDKGAGIKLELANGDDCGDTPRRATVFFPCDKSVGDIGNVLAQETAKCTYILTVPTKYACLDAAGMSGGWLFIILFIFFSTVYIVAGVLFNRMRYGAQGIEAFPNIEFWRELPGLVADGCRYSFNLGKCYYCSLTNKEEHEEI